MVEKHTNGDLIAPFYRALGLATSRWQHVEAAIFVLFHALLNTENQYSSAVFFHIKSADSKLQLLDRLCRVHFGKTIIDNEWKRLCGDVKNAVESRNKIAHYETNYILNVDWLDPDNPPVALTPPHLDAKSAWSEPTVRRCHGRLRPISL